MLCPRCGTPNRPEAASCVRCGRAFGARPAAKVLDILSDEEETVLESPRSPAARAPVVEARGAPARTERGDTRLVPELQPKAPRREGPVPGPTRRAAVGGWKDAAAAAERPAEARFGVSTRELPSQIENESTGELTGLGKLAPSGGSLPELPAAGDRSIPRPDPRLEATRAIQTDRPRPEARARTEIPRADAEATTPGAGLPQGGRITLSLASRRVRAASSILDGAVLGASVAIPLLLGAFGDTIARASLIEPDEVAPLLVNGDLTPPLAILGLLILSGSTVAHALFGRSLGKLALGLELVAVHTGRKPSVARALLRAVLTLVGAACGGVTYWWLLVDRQSRTLHDHLAGTAAVVTASRREETPREPEFVNEPTI